MRNRKHPIGIVVALVFFAAIVTAGEGLRASAKPAGDTGYWGFDTANLDKTCKPCDDFYQFAMGGWMKANEIPPQYSTWGSFSRLLDKNQQNLQQILETAENGKATPGSNEQKIGDFYASCMDTAAINAAGTKPIDAEMAGICRQRRRNYIKKASECCSGSGPIRMRRTLRRWSAPLGKADSGYPNESIT
jgi:predicted metalloendopeptidase